MTAGHADHFLSRLDRIAMPQVELALSLYRDDGLLKYVLATAKVPEGAERVAIALEDSATSPHIIVTREGRFVTCLGEGMAVDLPVVTRKALDGMATRVAGLRARMENAAKFVGPRGGVGQLLRRVHEAGDTLSREEVQALVGLQPLFPLELLRSSFAVTSDLASLRETLLRHLRRSPKLMPALRGVAHAYWKSFWAIGHFTLLAASGGPRFLESLPDEVREHIVRAPVSWGAVRQGISALALRGVWAAAKLGKLVLPATKALLQREPSDLLVVTAGMDLLALGARHKALRAEARKALEAGSPSTGHDATDKVYRAMCDMLLAIEDRDAKNPEQLAADVADVGASFAVVRGEELSDGNPYAFRREEDVPRELALPFAANVDAPFIGFAQTEAVMASTFLTVPWVARAAPEELYLPADVIRAIRSPWTPEQTLMLLQTQRLHYNRAPKAAPKPKISRQDPCPCGSGKKYKRCCEGAA